MHFCRTKENTKEKRTNNMETLEINETEKTKINYQHLDHLQHDKQLPPLPNHHVCSCCGTSEEERIASKPTTTTALTAAETTEKAKLTTADKILLNAVNDISARGLLRDRSTLQHPASAQTYKLEERSMKATVAAFNALTNHQLTEEQGWQFMVILKLARANGGRFHLDDYQDGAAYCALAGEAACAKEERYKTSLNNTAADFAEYQRLLAAVENAKDPETAAYARAEYRRFHQEVARKLKQLQEEDKQKNDFADDLPF